MIKVKTVIRNIEKKLDSMSAEERLVYLRSMGFDVKGKCKTQESIVNSTKKALGEK